MLNKANNSNKFKPNELTQGDGMASSYQKKMMLKNHNQLKNNYNSVAVPSHLQSQEQFDQGRSSLTSQKVFPSGSYSSMSSKNVNFKQKQGHMAGRMYNLDYQQQNGPPLQPNLQTIQQPASIQQKNKLNMQIQSQGNLSSNFNTIAHPNYATTSNK